MFTRILRRCAPLLAAASLAAAAFFFWGAGRATPVLSYGGYQTNLPNGDYLFASASKFPGSNTCLLCHGWNASTPGQILSSSASGYLAAALRSFSPGAGWGGHTAAASSDTDGDGFTNGEELQDPGGAWTPASGASFGDQSFVSNPNWNQNYPPAPIISSVSGLASNQTVSGKVAVSVALRYAGLSRVEYSFTSASTNRVFTVASPATTNYSAAYCLGYATAAPGACTAWDSTVLPDGVYGVTITAYDKRAAGLGGPQTATFQLSGVTIRNAVAMPTATMTMMRPTATPVPPTATPVPTGYPPLPTNTSLPSGYPPAPTNTSVPPTATRVVPPTSTPVIPPTATRVVPPTSTPVVPPTATPVVPPTATSIVPVGTAVPCTGTSAAYVVQQGDTLYRLAVRFGTSVNAIRRANGIRGSRITVGQTLTLPGGCRPTPVPKDDDSEHHSGEDQHKPEPTESHSGDDQSKNNAPSDDHSTTQSNDVGQKFYTVRAGDNLFRIGLRFGVSVPALQAANGLRSTNITVGQVLRLP